MPDPYKLAHPNEPVGFSATAENAKLDVAKWYAKNKRNLERTPDELIRQSGIVRIHNNTGADLTYRSVLGLNGPLFTPAMDLDAFLREVVLDGIVPTNIHYGLFGVTLEPVKADGICRAFVSGLCQVSINITNPGHAYADVSPGETTNLKSCGCGSAKILWVEDEGYVAYDDNPYGLTTGDKWAIVRLGNEAGRSRACMAPGGGIPAANSDGTIPGSASCAMYDWNRGTGQWVASGVSETVFNNGSAATSAGKIINVTYHQGTPFAQVDQC
jgi:hypothetical protein